MARSSASGRVVRAESEQPIRHARVGFVSPSTSSAESRLTDDNGRFDFDALEPAVYTVIVTATGYQELHSTAQVRGQTAPLLLQLRKVEEAASPLNNNVVSIQELKMSGRAEKVFNKGTRLLQRGETKQSLPYFDRAIEKDPTYYRAYHNLGLAHLRLGHRPEAERALQKAIDLTGGGYAPSDFAMGMALCQDQDYRRAEIVIQKGLEMDPGSATGKFYLALVQFASGRPIEAERNARQALSRDGNLAEVYFLLAGIHQSEQDAPALEQDLSNYLHIAPKSEQSDEARVLLAKVRGIRKETATESERR